MSYGGGARRDSPGSTGRGGGRRMPLARRRRPAPSESSFRGPATSTPPSRDRGVEAVLLAMDGAVEDLRRLEQLEPAVAGDLEGRLLDPGPLGGRHRLESADDLEVLVEDLLRVDPRDLGRDRQRQDVSQRVLDGD